MPWIRGELIPLADQPPEKANGECYSCGNPIPVTNLNTFYCGETCRIRAWLRYHHGWPPPHEKIAPS